LSDEEDYDSELGYIFSVNDDCWSAELLVNGKPHTFKLDTGAAVSVVGENWARSHKLQKSTRKLKGPGETQLTVLGTVQAELRHNGNSVTETLYCLKGQKHSLLSKSACVRLGLVARVNEVVDPDFKSEFPSLFKGLGALSIPYRISIDPDVPPTCIYAPRKIPHPLIPKVKEEIDRMLEQGIISPVTEPTSWCSGIVVVPKPNKSVRICVDLTNLNKAVRREIHPMATVDESLAKLSGSTVFTKLDAKNSFWQIPLVEESKLLTTFVTPFGRYCFNRMPMGISSASEVFQRTLSTILEGLEGVICHMDDMVVHAADKPTHDRRLRAVLQRLQEAGLTLNEKCEFSRSSVRFLGHVIDATGVHADGKKVEAIRNFPTPQNVPELQRFMGMINQLAKFVPNLADYTTPLRFLLRKDIAWVWGDQQESAFQKVKELLLSPPVLAHYNPQRPTVIAADASNNGIGAVMWQIQPDGSRRPVCFISRSLSDTEKNYAVIEKEALAVTWACERLTEYVQGLDLLIETDHKPLVTLLGKAELHKVPPRIQRFRLRLMRYHIKVVHVPGKNQITADALSRAPVSSPEKSDDTFVSETTAYAQQSIDFLPTSTKRLQEIRDAQKADPETSQIRGYCTNGWPAVMPESPLLKQYWVNRDHFTVVEDLLLFDDRLVIPRDLRLNILDLLHEGHMGITKTRALATTCVWWPNISSHIEETVNKCNTCAVHRPERKEPLLPSSFPERPWSRLGMDLFDLKGKTFLVVVDYYSRWVELRPLKKLTSSHTINHIKSMFGIHGIPDIVVTDNGPQFSSAEFRKFAKDYGFVHTTSSPRYPQSNGEAERCVQTVKKLLKKAKDPHAALLLYRTTPLQNGFTPSQLLMGRILKTKVPILPSCLSPKTPNHPQVQKTEAQQKEKQRQNFDRRHAAKEAPPLAAGDTVYVKDMAKPGEVLAKHHNPRSYVVRTEQGTIRRNRAHLVPIPGEPSPPPRRPIRFDPAPSPKAATQPPPQQPTLPAPVLPGSPMLGRTSTPAVLRSETQTPTAIQTPRTRSGRLIKQPDRLNL
jgi:hypothetical protein